MSTMTLANHRSAAKPRRPGRLVRRPVARNGRHPAANRAATRATAATTGGQKIDYTRGRWPMMQSFSATHADYSDQTTSSYYNTLVLTQDADGKSLVDLDLSTYPSEEGKALFKYEVVRGTGQTVAAGTFATAPIVELTAPTPGDDAFYEFFAWLDKNNNGLRDTGEDVKTLAAQQDGYAVSSEDSASIDRADIAANETYVTKELAVTVKSGAKGVQGVGCDHVATILPNNGGNVIVEPEIVYSGVSDPNGNIIATIKVSRLTTPGTYQFKIFAQGHESDGYKLVQIIVS